MVEVIGALGTLAVIATGVALMLQRTELKRALATLVIVMLVTAFGFVAARSLVKSLAALLPAISSLLKVTFRLVVKIALLVSIVAAVIIVLGRAVGKLFQE